MSTASELEPPLEYWSWKTFFGGGCDSGGAWASFSPSSSGTSSKVPSWTDPCPRPSGPGAGSGNRAPPSFRPCGRFCDALAWIGPGLQGIDKPHSDNRRCPLRPLRTLPRSLLFRSSTPSDAPQASLDVGMGFRTMLDSAQQS